MPGLVQIRIKGDDEIMRKFRNLSDAGRRRAGKRTIAAFHIWLWNEVKTAWDAVTAKGGIFRGETWAPMKEQYTRKTDDVTVPAWGGVPYARGGFKTGAKTKLRNIGGKIRDGVTTGSVKGKLRPSGSRVMQSSVMMVDTKNMRADMFFNARVKDERHLVLEPSPVNMEYAEAQNNRRRFAFFTPRDEKMFYGVATVEINKVVREEGLA